MNPSVEISFKTCLVSYSDDDYNVAMEEEMNVGYLRFLQAKDENKRMEGTRLAKRMKKANVRVLFPADQ